MQMHIFLEGYSHESLTETETMVLLKIQAMDRWSLKLIHHSSQTNSKHNFSTENEAGHLCSCQIFASAPNVYEKCTRHHPQRFYFPVLQCKWSDVICLHYIWYHWLPREDSDAFPPRVWIIASRTFISLSRLAISCCFARNSSMCSSNTSALNQVKHVSQTHIEATLYGQKQSYLVPCKLWTTNTNTKEPKNHSGKSLNYETHKICKWIQLSQDEERTFYLCKSRSWNRGIGKTYVCAKVCLKTKTHEI